MCDVLLELLIGLITVPRMIHRIEGILPLGDLFWVHIGQHGNIRGVGLFVFGRVAGDKEGFWSESRPITSIRKDILLRFEMIDIMVKVGDGIRIQDKMRRKDRWPLF